MESVAGETERGCGEISFYTGNGQKTMIFLPFTLKNLLVLPDPNFTPFSVM